MTDASRHPAAPLKKTALHERHRLQGAKMTDFHGWDMPLYYTSILEEHKAVRESVGIFDISHMGQVIVSGPDAAETLDALVVSDIKQVGQGRACYTLLLNEAGGIIDDLIIYRIGEEDFLLIINCGNRESDVAWIQSHRKPQTKVNDISQGRSILAVQGPAAARVLEQMLDAKVMGLARFGIAPIRTMGPESCIARTGYTGSDGFELFLADNHARKLWDAVLAETAGMGGLPIGLGARDTLRVEAGLRLYGTDMDTATTPYEAGLGWTVALNKADFIGRDVLVRQKAEGLARKFVGFELAQGPVPRQGCILANGEGRAVGAVTSGTFSPILNRPLGMGYVETVAAAIGNTLTVAIRTQRYPATIVKLPFWSLEKESSAAAGLPAPARQLENRS